MLLSRKEPFGGVKEFLERNENSGIAEDRCLLYGINKVVLNWKASCLVNYSAEVKKMRTRNDDFKMIGGVFFHVVVFITLVFILAGCVGVKSPTLVLDRELDYAFTGYQVLPDHRYYITGGYVAPRAILAIHTDYQLDNGSHLWVEVPAVDSSQIQLWMDNYHKYAKPGTGTLFMAAYIVNPDRKRVGAWYSRQRETRVDFLENNRIKVYPPDMERYIFNK